MRKLERIRENLSAPMSPEQLREREAGGWRMAAVIWEREVQAAGEEEREIEIPYGLRVAADCSRLEEDPGEKEVLVLAMEQIVQDRPLSQVAAELNRQGYLTRQGARWTPGAVFDLLPRIIEVGPRIFSEKEWPERRRRFMNAV